ncbi:MAG: YlbF family regulator [Clostridiales bacterium]|nr:YlbF family regulator [Clostridiales bacterium]
MADVVKLARELGAAIQQDERYKAFEDARKANEADDALNDLIGKLNLIQLNYNQEMQKETPDKDKVSGFDKEFREIYTQVMANKNMQNYENARHAIDDMMNYLIGILSLSVNGEDPATCEPHQHDEGCSCDCSSCGGCH